MATFTAGVLRSTVSLLGGQAGRGGLTCPQTGATVRPSHGSR
ncbi:hypothetical protein OHA77_28800 [Streptosporangium sp. NBC_01639]|nr:hypothetical protein OHA77_28800 [Streptosporangium sp. NBC_01639]